MGGPALKRWKLRQRFHAFMPEGTRTRWENYACPKCRIVPGNPFLKNKLCKPDCPDNVSVVPPLHVVEGDASPVYVSGFTGFIRVGLGWLLKTHPDLVLNFMPAYLAGELKRVRVDNSILF